MKIENGITIYDSIDEMSNVIKKINKKCIKINENTTLPEKFKYVSFDESAIGDVINLINESGSVISSAKCISCIKKKVSEIKNPGTYIKGLNESNFNEYADKDLFITELAVSNISKHLLNKDDDLFNIYINKSSFAYDIFDYKHSLTENYKHIMSLSEGLVNFISRKLGILTPNKINFKRYSEIANKHIDDPYLYIVLTVSASTVANIINSVTMDPFNHASISFDSKLDTMLSIAIFPDDDTHKLKTGLRWEHPILTFNNKAKMEIYKVKVGSEKKRELLNILKGLNSSGLEYDIDHLLLSSMFDLDNNENIKPVKHKSIVCSEFVYLVFKDIGITLFDKIPGTVKPYDFVKLSSKKTVIFHDEGNIYEWFFNKAHKELMDGKKYVNPPHGIYRFKYVTAQIKSIAGSIGTGVKNIVMDGTEYIMLPISEE